MEILKIMLSIWLISAVAVLALIFGVQLKAPDFAKHCENRSRYPVYGPLYAATRYIVVNAYLSGYAWIKILSNAVDMFTDALMNMVYLHDTDKICRVYYFVRPLDQLSSYSRFRCQDSYSRLENIHNRYYGTGARPNYGEKDKEKEKKK